MHRDLIWPIGIIASFVVAIIGFGSFIVFAVFQRNDLVLEDYYAHELVYQQRIDSAARALALTEPPALVHDGNRHALRLSFPTALLASLERGSLKLYRPSNADLDFSVPLQLDADGIQWIDAARMASGLWKAQLSWFAEGHPYFIESALILP